MTTLSDAILIQDNEESSIPEPGRSRLRTGTRPDYSCRGFEAMFHALADDDGDTTPSRKRKRGEANGESDFEKILKKAGKGVTHKIQQLENQKQQLEDQNQQLEDQKQELKDQKQQLEDQKQQLEDQNLELEDQKQELEDQSESLRDELFQEREKHQRTQEVLSQELAKRVCECKICYQQPDQWVMISCGHMFCKPCADRVQLQIPKRCPSCRAPIRGCFDCLPFAG